MGNNNNSESHALNDIMFPVMCELNPVNNNKRSLLWRRYVDYLSELTN